MFKFLVSIEMLMLLTLTFDPVFSQESTPYLYYYAPKLTTFMVERADGADRHEFGRDVLAIPNDVPAAVPSVNGVGWSPDGRWFTFARGGEGRPDGFILRLDGTEYQLEQGVLYSMSATRADAVEDLWSVEDMYWSPNSRYLLVWGHPDPRPNLIGDLYINFAYWLIDLQTNRTIGQFDYRRGLSSPQYTPIQWNIDGHPGSVSFYIQEDDRGRRQYPFDAQITIYFDGRIVKQPSSESGMIPLDISSVPYFRVNIISPSGRYRITGENQLIDNEQQSTIDLPPPDFGDNLQEFSPYPAEAIWDVTETWIIVGYNIYSSSGVDGIAIVRSDGSEFRVLSAAQCGHLENACVGWLPENVDVDAIPPATNTP